MDIDFTRLVQAIDAETDKVVPPTSTDALDEPHFRPRDFDIQGHIVQVEAWGDDPPIGGSRQWHIRLLIKGPVVRFNETGVWKDYAFDGKVLEGVRTKLAALAVKMTQAGNLITSALTA